jgi:hypothetical protein
MQKLMQEEFPDFTIADFTKVFQSVKTEAKWLELILHSQRRTKIDPKTIILLKMEPDIQKRCRATLEGLATSVTHLCFVNGELGCSSYTSDSGYRIVIRNKIQAMLRNENECPICAETKHSLSACPKCSYLCCQMCWMKLQLVCPQCRK